MQFYCSCGAKLQAGEDFAGRKVRCPRCGNLVVAAEEEFVASPVDQPSPGQARPHWPEPRRDERAFATPQASGKATAALVLGIVSFCLPGIASVLAVIFGFLARGDIKRSGGRQGGAGMALAGIILGLVTILMIPVTIALLIPAVQKVREAAAKTVCANNMRTIALAFHDYHRVHGQFPPAAVYDKDGRPLHSWRVLLLPHLNRDDLFHQFNLEEPWDSPNNRRLLSQMPDVYKHPNPPSGADPTATYFQVFDGPANAKSPTAIFVSKSKKHRPSLVNIPDGTSNTILLAEAGEGVPWTKPGDLHYEPDRPLPKLGGHFSGGFHVVMADALIHFIDPRQVSERTLRLAITADDGQRPLPADWPEAR